MASFWKTLGKSTDAALVAVESVNIATEVMHGHAKQFRADAMRSLRIAASLSTSVVGIAHAAFEKLEDNDAFTHLSPDAKLQLLTTLVNEELTFLGKSNITTAEVKLAFPDLYPAKQSVPPQQPNPAAGRPA